MSDWSIDPDMEIDPASLKQSKIDPDKLCAWCNGVGWVQDTTNPTRLNLERGGGNLVVNVDLRGSTCCVCRGSGMKDARG